MRYLLLVLLLLGCAKKPAPVAPVGHAPTEAVRPLVITVPVVLRSVHFAHDVDTLKPGQVRMLVQQKACPKLLTGYADTTGSTSYNLALALRRAESVRRVLIACPDVSIVAYGETNHFGTPYKNRRVTQE